MKLSERKPRYQSEPLPSRTDPVSSPSEEGTGVQQPSKQSSAGTQPLLLLTPISAADDPPPPFLPEGFKARASDAPDKRRHHPPPLNSVPSHDPNALTVHPPSDPPKPSPMSLRVDRLLSFDRPHHDSYRGRQSPPPPITTLTDSPSLSSDRSSISSPAPTVLPSLVHPYHTFPSHNQYPGLMVHPSYPLPHSQYHPQYYGQDTISPPEVFSSSMYGIPHQPYQVNSYPPVHVHHSSHSMPGPYGQTTIYPPQQQVLPIYTSDASTKPSTTVRRRCFNCCTTDTSTWRRSSLNPGKVLCNKCGLFERTHHKSRPDTFPQKQRGLPTSPTMFQSQAPPPPLPRPVHHGQYDHRSLPPVSPSQPHNLNVPPHPTHPSLDSYNRQNTLPQIEAWLREPTSSSGISNGTAQTQQPPTSSSPNVFRSPLRSNTDSLPMNTLPSITSSTPRLHSLPGVQSFTPSPSPPYQRTMTRSPSPQRSYISRRVDSM